MTHSAGDSEDSIHIHELELSVCIGVPENERANPQRLTGSITLWPDNQFGQLHDELERTIDYADVCRSVKALVAARTDKLLETLAEAIAGHLLANFAVRRVQVELRKFILPDVNYVAVSITRSRWG
ncbi:MAG: dihydroneopterin aldolase [Verrucomicrobiota bacterium]|nr:dihydroneopterin aldolase [Verrucomicrobiota bacterium]